MTTHIDSSCFEGEISTTRDDLRAEQQEQIRHATFVKARRQLGAVMRQRSVLFQVLAMRRRITGRPIPDIRRRTTTVAGFNFPNRSK